MTDTLKTRKQALASAKKFYGGGMETVKAAAQAIVSGKCFRCDGAAGDWGDGLCTYCHDKWADG